jgi:hypothetical protein
LIVVRLKDNIHWHRWWVALNKRAVRHYLYSANEIKRRQASANFHSYTSIPYALSRKLNMLTRIPEPYKKTLAPNG